MRRRLAVLATFLLACDAPDSSHATGVSGSTGTPPTTDGAESTGAEDASSSAGTAGGEGSTSDAGSTGDEGGAPTPTGVELYMSLCSGCHGLEAEGTELGYELRHPDRGLYTHVIRSGREGLEFESSQMAAYGEDVISDAQLEELYDWLDAFPQPAGGEGLYADYCANCHGTVPESGVITAEILGRSFSDLQEKIRQGEGGTDYALRSGYMSAYDPEMLSDEQIQAIAEWL